MSRWVGNHGWRSVTGTLVAQDCKVLTAQIRSTNQDWSHFDVFVFLLKLWNHQLWFYMTLAPSDCSSIWLWLHLTRGKVNAWKTRLPSIFNTETRCDYVFRTVLWDTCWRVLTCDCGRSVCHREPINHTPTKDDRIKKMTDPVCKQHAPRWKCGWLSDADVDEMYRSA